MMLTSARREISLATTSSITAQIVTPGDAGTLVLLSLLWGSAYVLLRALDGALPPQLVVAGRLVTAGVVLHVVLALRGERLTLDRKEAGQYLILGLLNNAIPFELLAWGEVRVTGGMAAMLGATTPFFGILLSFFSGSADRVSAAKLVSILVAFAGVSLLVLPTLTAGGGVDAFPLAACLLAAAMYAVGAFYGQRFSGQSPLQTVTGQITGAAFPAIIMAAFAGFRPLIHQPPITWAGLVAMGVVCTALPYLLFFRLLRRIGTNNTLIVTMLVPISSVLIGHIALAEHLERTQLAGMALIVAALLVINDRIVSKLPGRRIMRNRIFGKI